MFGACPARTPSPFPLITGRIDLLFLFFTCRNLRRFFYVCLRLFAFFLYPILSFIVSFFVDKLERGYFVFLYCMYIKKVFIK